MLKITPRLGAVALAVAALAPSAVRAYPQVLGPGGVYVPPSPVAATGLLGDGVTPCPIPSSGCAPVTPGSTGADFSANTPSLPNVGASFAAGGAYPNYVLLTTVPAGAVGCVHVENDSGAQIVLVLDDGAAASGAAPTNASAFALGGGAVPGAQGGSTGPEFCAFKGRVQIYAPSASAQVFAARW